MDEFFMRLTEKTYGDRIDVKGKFLFKGNDKFYVKGVTYGTFEPDSNGDQFPSQVVIENDFRFMASKGINSVRTYTVPPISLLNAALKYDLKVMVGLPWEQHITFLDDKKTSTGIIQRMKDDVLRCQSHPAILCFTIGNEIPAGIVRWYGKRKIENFLEKLYLTVKSADPDALVTYVNYPTTEYLDLSFLDFDCFNVYLETPEKLGNYIARLQNLSGEKPLVLAEIGLDSRRNSEEKQAEVLQWQIETIFTKGCAGMFVFAWTDEWWRGGYDIEDWDFGIVSRDRTPKPALSVIKRTFASAPVTLNDDYPFISVIVCSYNGSATIRECLTGILNLDYPSFEVIVINDGSTDDLENIVKEFPVKLISTPNRGLSNARNAGMLNARGEILAYIDDDAFPDPQWLQYLAYAFRNSQHACIGGPNIAPSDDGFIATAVANAPGGPVHVLLSDEIAEHVPGCNMAFRRKTLMEIGGFDPVYRSAGDDVDVCWRIQEAGYTVGFHPGALVWHRRRNSFKAYWRQQKGYGKAEALLEAKWPEKYNRFGHLNWAGRIYGNGFTLPVSVKKEKIFHGVWGSALFQSVYQPAGGFLNSIPLMPEWYMFTGFFGFIGLLGLLWTPLLWGWVLFGASITIILVQAIISANQNIAAHLQRKASFKLKSFIVILHIIQPVARLYGRLRNGLTPWRFRGAGFSKKFIFSFGPKSFKFWSEHWYSNEQWLTMIERSLIKLKTRVKRGGDFDRWDLQTGTGLFIKYRSILTIEEHGAGKQYLRFRTSIHYSAAAILFPVVIGGLLAASLIESEWLVTVVAALLLGLCLLQFLLEKTSSLNSLYIAFKRLKKTQRQQSAKEKEENTVQEDSLSTDAGITKELAPH